MSTLRWLPRSNVDSSARMKPAASLLWALCSSAWVMPKPAVSSFERALVLKRIPRAYRPPSMPRRCGPAGAWRTRYVSTTTGLALPVGRLHRSAHQARARSQGARGSHTAARPGSEHDGSSVRMGIRRFAETAAPIRERRIAAARPAGITVEGTVSRADEPMSRLRSSRRLRGEHVQVDAVRVVR